MPFRLRTPLTFGERVLVGLAVVFAVGGLGARALLASRAVAVVAPRLASWFAGEHDPWGRPWCEHRRPGAPFRVIWSAGPDGVDQRGGGDDLLGSDWPAGCPLWPLLASPRATCAVTALLLGWGVLVGRLASAPRRRELARAAVGLLPPSAAIVGAAVAVADDEQGELMDALVIPFPIAALGTAAMIVLFLAILWLQLRRAAAAEAVDAQEQRRAGRWILLSLGLCAAVPLGLGLLGAEARVSRRDCGVARARLRLIGWAQTSFWEAQGRPASADELVAAGLVSRRLLEPWRGYAIDLQVGPPSSPGWITVAVPLPGTTVYGSYYFAERMEVLWAKRSPHQLGPGVTLDPTSMPESW